MLHTKPEMVLRRADELLSVNQPTAALSAISEVFSSKRFRSTPLSTLEPILIKFLELCVDLRKGRTAKDGLIQYKNVAQNTSVQSVEVVLQKFLEHSRAKLTDAIAKVDELEGTIEKKDGADADVEDLEATETPESILLSAVSEEKSRDRTYRTLVTPWLRFLWEAYRTALDILRNNARLEVLYQTVSQDAFQFCLRYQRKTEFRRLCETLRSHLTSSQKYTHQTHSINLNDPDTLQRHLDTRFQQLNTAVELELWQEGFRTAEDIHTLLSMSKRAPKASMMASFYDKMSKVFAVGQNFLFHAAAYGKLYGLHAARVALSGDKGEDAELEKLSALVLLSALAIPLGSGVESAKKVEAGEEGETKGRVGRLAALIGLTAVPTRAGLINDSLNRHVLKRVTPELRELYNILEVDFHPLSITSKIEPILASLEKNPETARYVAPLKDVVLARLFQQLAQVYASLKIDRVVKLASFRADGEKDVTRKRVERYVTEACRRGDVDVTIDHATGSINFDQEVFGDEAGPVASTSAAFDSVKTLQPSASTLLRTHLARLASTLYTTLNQVNPSSSPIAAAEVSRSAAFESFSAQVADERDNLIARTQIIKRRKELSDEQLARKEKEDAHARSLRAQQQAEEESKRQKEELKKRELERIRKEVEKVKADEAKKVAENMIKSGLKVDMEKVPEMSANDLVQLQVKQLEKDKNTLSQKLASVHKRMDHLERAFRKEEIPLIQQDYQRQQARDREAFESARVHRAESARQQHSEKLAIKAGLAKILPDYESYRSKMEKESRAAFEAESQRLREQLEEAKAERRAQVAEQRERERAEREEYERQQEEQRVREEEQARLRAEQEEREAEERARIEERRRALEAEAAQKAAEEREKRLAERRADQEKIMAQARREEEALARRQNRPVAAADAGPAIPGTAAYRAARGPLPSAAAPAAAGGERPRFQLQPRTASQPASAESTPPASRSGLPPAVGEGRPAPAAGGWREREAARAAAAGQGSTSLPPPVGAAPPTRPIGKWTAARQAGDSSPAEESSRPSTPAAQGRYQPPSARAGGGSRW
ncbi:translation initiation factor eIF3 core subunit a [Sporobolomyces koalae]|uniref:translation initiation factor eIF3 core subunit a n=1 Tax=Sporobolomyces koalae TaxID=500713 RepID=UPI00317CCBB6